MEGYNVGHDTLTGSEQGGVQLQILNSPRNMVDSQAALLGIITVQEFTHFLIIIKPASAN